MYNNKNTGFKISYNYDDFDDEQDIYSSTGRDISSRSYEDISSYTSAGKHSASGNKNKKGKKKRKLRLPFKILIILLCVVLALGAAFYAYGYKLLSKMERTELDEGDLGISTSNFEDVKNIALLGLDTRSDNKSGRSDANVILTIDKKHKKIKLTSIARDTYVAIDGHNKDKLTHAYAYGRSQLAVKTLNQNFGAEITDYVTMNFFELARVIDYIGGITIDVSEAEYKELNGNVIPNTDFGDIPCKRLTKSGVQVLSGAQAVCYARIRHTDSDVERGNRQKEVLTAMFDKVKKMNVLKLPEVASMIIDECETSLSTNDIIQLGTWAVANSPEFEQLSLPNNNVVGKGSIVGGVWYYVYDLDKAKQEIHDFIKEENYYSPEEVAKRATAESN